MAGAVTSISSWHKPPPTHLIGGVNGMAARVVTWTGPGIAVGNAGESDTKAVGEAVLGADGVVDGLLGDCVGGVTAEPHAHSHTETARTSPNASLE